MYDTVGKDSLESAALQQLLVRVLAEKDSLKFQNSNLRKITRRRKAQEQRTQDREGIPALPHRSSSDLNEKVDERDHRSDTRGNRRKVSEFTSSFGSQAVCPVKYRLTPKGYNVEPPPAYVATYTPSSFSIHRASQWRAIHSPVDAVLTSLVDGEGRGGGTIQLPPRGLRG